MPTKEYPHKRPRTEATTTKAKKFADASEIRFALRTDSQEGLVEGPSDISSSGHYSNVISSSRNSSEPAVYQIPRRNDRSGGCATGPCKAVDAKLAGCTRLIFCLGQYNAGASTVFLGTMTSHRFLSASRRSSHSSCRCCHRCSRCYQRITPTMH